MKIIWPLVWRKDLDAARERAATVERNYRREIEAKEKEWREKWKPVLDRMIKLSTSRRDQLGSFVLHTELDRYMLEQAAQFNDEHIWRYIGEMAGHHVSRQLTQLNFAGLHRLADELEDRRPRRMSSIPHPFE